jgi:glycerol uptake facilitator-like aquaporin
VRSKLLAEFVGTAFLLMGVVGSGIMAQNLTDDVGLQLLQNAFATAGVLVAIILAFATVSGAHFNPVVTLAEWAFGSLSSNEALAYVASQVAGGIVGVAFANIMFELDPIHWSSRDRSSTAEVFAEVIATIGLLVVIFGTVRGGNAKAVAFAVAGYIGGAYYFTSSTSFANPAVTIGRTMSDTFAGIEPASAPGFIAAQLGGAAIAIFLIRAIYPAKESDLAE